jgi:hypothetical protein
MIVSLTGLIGSGKDTVADHLIKEHGFVQLSFAESVKDALAVIFGWDREMLEGKTKEHREARNQVDVWWANQLDIPHFTPRWAMTTFGTDVMRKHFDDRIWVLSVKDKITRLRQKNPNVKIVISDARYVNELITLAELDSLSFEISRGPLPDWWISAIVYNKCENWLERKICKLFYKYISNTPNIFNKNIHSSEYDWIGYQFNHTLYNNSTIDSLKENVDLFLLLRTAYKRASNEAVDALLTANEKLQ